MIVAWSSSMRMMWTFEADRFVQRYINLQGMHIWRINSSLKLLLNEEMFLAHISHL